jgi:hypothetical protein
LLTYLCILWFVYWSFKTTRRRKWLLRHIWKCTQQLWSVSLFLSNYPEDRETSRKICVEHKIGFSFSSLDRNIFNNFAYSFVWVRNVPSDINPLKNEFLHNFI